MSISEKFMDDLNFLVLKWTNQGVKLNEGISLDSYTKLETDFNYSFEKSFYNYFTKFNGFADFDSDEEWFSFWADTRIKEENEDGSHPKDVIWFCDHSINLCSFGFHKIDKKIYTHYQHNESIECVADTFYEFVEIYRKDPYLLLR
jgi:hypothetical protein